MLYNKHGNVWLTFVVMLHELRRYAQRCVPLAESVGREAMVAKCLVESALRL